MFSRKRMRSFPYLLILALSVLTAPLALVAATDAPRTRSIISMDTDWSFTLGDPAGAAQVGFDAAAWARVNVPHDWSIAGHFDEAAPTEKDGAFLPSGVCWYRKHFTVPEHNPARRIFVEFDGVMANSEVWLNGHLLGKRPFGYVSFRYELTPYLNPGDAAVNVLAVRADTAGQPAARWYTGAGIYRHVRLITTDAVHLEHWSTHLTTPKISPTEAILETHSVVANSSTTTRNVALLITVLDPDGHIVTRAESAPSPVATGATANLTQTISIATPRLWDLESPTLYQVHVELRADGATLDDELVPFGFRDARFEADTGFWLNGKSLKIKGVCLHHDGGAFGAAVPLSVWTRRLEILRSLGVNAIRTAHNPVAPEFLDLCDRMGFLVMDEFLDAWSLAKRPYDYHLHFPEWALIDTRDTIRRDRNHPCVILYSAGNEIRDTAQTNLAKKNLAALIEVFHREDPARPVTQALFRPNRTKDYANGLADMLDVVGQNYREKEILAAHAQKPTRKIIGTENTHAVYAWTALRDNAPYAGQFIWAGIDYLGESPAWPFIGTDYGIIDRTGSLRPRSYQRMSWWSATPMVHMTRRVAGEAPAVVDPGYENTAEVQQLLKQQKERALFSDWTPLNRQPHAEAIEVYSNAEQIELLLNGQSLGSQASPADASPRHWRVPFAPGVLQAIARNAGVVVATHELRTAGEPARVILKADRATLAHSWDDVATIEAVIVDAQGVPVPQANQLVTFSTSGPVVISAVDNGNNSSHEPFRATQRSAYNGHCFAFIHTTADTGEFTVTASVEGLHSASVTLQASPASPALSH